MMAPRKSEAASQRPKQSSKNKGGMTQLVVVGVGIVVVIVVALLLFGGGGKKTAAPRANKAASDTGATYDRAKTSSSAPVHRVSRAKAAHDSLIARRREARLKRDQEMKASGGRTSRTARGGYTSGSSSRAATSPNQLRAILTDDAGARTALVGERRLKVGDDLDGHRIVDVTGDGVKVEYRTNTYSVRVGEKLY